MYYTLTKDETMHPIHDHEVLTLMRSGRTVYAADQLPRISYHPRYVWIAGWLDPKVLKAAEIQLKSAGYATFSEHTVRMTVRWDRGYYSRSPRESFRVRPTDPGRIWIQVRVPAGFYSTVRVADEIDPNETRLVPADSPGRLAAIGAATKKIESATDMVRVSKNPSGEVVWQETPIVGLGEQSVDWEPGDLIYVSSEKTWGRFWNYLPDDRHYAEIGAVYLPGVPADGRIRDQYRVGIVPVTQCVRVLEDFGHGFGASGDLIAQAGSGGRRWRTNQVAAMS